MPPTSVQEWVALPELLIPEIQNPYETGVRVRVLNVGMLSCRHAEAAAAGLTSVELLPDAPPGGKDVALPTATVETDQGAILYRLPQPLGDWAFSAVALARQSLNAFPSLVEFSKLNGRYTADTI